MELYIKPFSLEAEDQELQQEDDVEAEEYNPEDDVPDPEASGQPDDENPPQVEDLPDDMEGLEDQQVCWSQKKLIFKVLRSFVYCHKPLLFDLLIDYPG